MEFILSLKLSRNFRYVFLVPWSLSGPLFILLSLSDSFFHQLDISFNVCQKCNRQLNCHYILEIFPILPPFIKTPCLLGFKNIPEPHALGPPCIRSLRVTGWIEYNQLNDLFQTIGSTLLYIKINVHRKHLR